MNLITLQNKRKEIMKFKIKLFHVVYVVLEELKRINRLDDGN